MINFNTINLAIKSMLESSPYFNNYTIEIGEPLNADPALDWVGVYRDIIKYDPKFLGRGAQNYLADLSVRVVVQDFNFDDKEKDLEERVNALIEVIDADRTIKGSVSMVTGIAVEYSFIDSDDESFFFQMATIVFNLQARA